MIILAIVSSSSGCRIWGDVAIAAALLAVHLFAQVGATIGAVGSQAGGSKTQQLKEFLESGKKIIISTIQTFPFVLDEIGNSHRGSTFAIIIDEAHSSQGGRTAAKMAMALSEQGEAMIGKRVRVCRLQSKVELNGCGSHQQPNPHVALPHQPSELGTSCFMTVLYCFAIAGELGVG